MKLAIVPRPRGGDWLQDDTQRLREKGIDVLVSLLTPQESCELGLEQEEAACRAAGIHFRNFATPDRQTPESVTAFLNFARDVYQEAQAGLSIGAHCRACIGRSSVLLAALMRLDGFSAEEAFRRISQARGMQVPDTEEQAVWVARLPL
ncbi:MAG TPA: protein-tyrosine phosphatase family protein [Acidobacteriaceae bacterium]